VTARQAHEASAFAIIVASINAAGNRELAARSDFQKALQGVGTTLLKTVDGEIADELQTQLTNLKALGELPDLP
jgi:hypothetical protein